MSAIIRSFSGRYAALSPTFLSGFFYEGDEYQSATAAFEAAKILNRADRVSFFAWNCKPWEARRKGRSVPPSWIRPDFGVVELEVMLAIQRSKFSWPEPQRVLLASAEAELIYSNASHDNHWGVCTCRDATPGKRKYGIGRRCTGEGDNFLGKILMQVRRELVASGCSVAA